MAKIKKKLLHEHHKNGLFFVVFILAVCLIILAVTNIQYRLKQQDQAAGSNGNSNININNSNKNKGTNSANNKNVNKNSPIKNINVNKSSNANLSSENNGTGGELVEINAAELGITILNSQSATKTVSGDITTFSFGQERSLSIMPENYEGIVKNSVSAAQEEDVTVASVPGVRIIGSSAKDGSVVTIILVKKNGELYHFKGDDVFLNNLEEYIKFN